MDGRTSQIRVMVLDQDPLVHIGLKTIFKQQPGIKLIGCASTFEEAQSQLEKSQPDILLTEAVLPDRSGAEACRDIIQEFPTIRVLFLTCHQEKTAIYSAVLAGASGFLLKDSAMDRLVSVIELIADGHSIFERDTLKEVQEWMSQQSGPEEVADWNLSPQQTRIVELVAQGKTNKEIAEALELSEKTVRNYLATVFKKLHITQRSRIASLFSNLQGE